MQFRLLLDSAHSGAWNMAADETLLRRNASGNPLPTLRFYSWAPRCLSLGRLQKQLPPGALLEVNERPFEVVRRPTGGRAVWHAAEITYAISAPSAFLPEAARSVQGAYEWLSRGFLVGLQSVGVNSELAPPATRGDGGPNCFAASAACDFLVNGKKLIGAAQCRLDGAFLQHGSLLLSLDAREWEETTGGPMSGATSLEGLGVSASPEEVVAALCEGFERACGATLHPTESMARPHEPMTRSTEPTAHSAIRTTRTVGRTVDSAERTTRTAIPTVHSVERTTGVGGWDADEVGEIERLVARKYGTPEWTFDSVVPLFDLVP